jgi:2-haloacid dehalogenase
MPPEVHALVFDTYGTVVDWRSAVLEALEALGASLARHRITGLTERELDGLVQARWRLAAWPDAVPGLTRLKQRYVISPLSNASFTGMVRLAKFAGLP